MFSRPRLIKGQGSDHCPVYAVMKDRILIGGEERDVRDVMNPPGMFVTGKRQREYSAAYDPLPLSGKLIPEFFGRRNIRDMFARKPSFQQSQSIDKSSKEMQDSHAKVPMERSPGKDPSKLLSGTASASSAIKLVIPASSPSVVGKKRSVTEVPSNRSSKRTKSGSAAAAPPAMGKGQQSLKGFFRPKSVPIVETQAAEEPQKDNKTDGPILQPSAEILEAKQFQASHDGAASLPSSINSTPRDATTPARMIGLHSNGNSPLAARNDEYVHDPVESKESWSKLFMKPAAPRCEGHDEPCITLLTKKPGMNLGRSFWMCPRPLGLTGAKEKNTQWRCQTFIWCSDWNPNAASAG